jgi:hypothetical protein
MIEILHTVAVMAEEIAGFVPTRVGLGWFSYPVERYEVSGAPGTLGGLGLGDFVASGWWRADFVAYSIAYCKNTYSQFATVLRPT